jgi:hypothetical protein
VPRFNFKSSPPCRLVSASSAPLFRALVSCTRKTRATTDPLEGSPSLLILGAATLVGRVALLTLQLVMCQLIRSLHISIGAPSPANRGPDPVVVQDQPQAAKHDVGVVAGPLP